MTPSRAASRFAVLRYEFRILRLRLVRTRFRALDAINLVLALVGAWSVIYSTFRWFPSSVLHVPTVAFLAILLAIWLRLAWVRLARRPQDIFRVAAASESTVEEFRMILAEGMRNETAYDSLLQIYLPVIRQIEQTYADICPEIPVDSSGRPCLVVTWRQGSETSVDDLLVGAGPGRNGEWQHRTSAFAPERQMFVAASRRSLTHQNRFGDDYGANVVLDELRPVTRMEMTVQTASYGQIVRTSDSLINEFALFGYVSGRSAVLGRPKPLTFRSGDLLKVLPWRRAVHAWDNGVDVLLAPRGRASGIGVSAALVDRAGPRPTATVGRRSPRVGTYPDVLHVIPAGMINVHGDEVGGAGSAMHLLARLTIMAEFLEECFDVEELSGHSVGNFSALVQKEVQTRDLDGLNPILTGVSIDLLNLRSEICAVIDLTGRRDIVDGFRVSWEYTHNERLQQVDLNRGAHSLDRTDFVQSGIGCIHLASRWVSQISARGF